MSNINNNVAAFVPVGSHVSIAANPAVFAVIPTDATGIIFSFSAGGTFTLDGTTPDATTGLNFAFAFVPLILHLYPGQRLDFFATGGVLNYQFIRTSDTYSLTSRR